MLTQTEIAEEKKVFERNDKFSLKTSLGIKKNISMNKKNHISLDFKSLVCRPPLQSAYHKTIFLISQPKHMLWVLKRTVSMRRFFCAPKTYF